MLVGGGSDGLRRRTLPLTGFERKQDQNPRRQSHPEMCHAVLSLIRPTSVLPIHAEAARLRLPILLCTHLIEPRRVLADAHRVNDLKILQA